MAVYKRSYTGYTGKITPRRSRFLILTRYSARGVFQSRIMTGLFILSFFFPLFTIAALYLNHNAHVLSLLQLPARDHFLNIDGKLFMGLMSFQGSFAFLITALIGPGLIAPDLTNNSLPLYFCRPLSRTEYVLGRACVILFLLSFVTWIPGLLIFGVQSSLADGWAWDHLRIAAGIMIGSLLWISILTLLALALSAWVRWKVVAGGLLLGVMFATTGFAGAIEAVMHSSAGFYLDPAAMVAVIYSNFFDVTTHFDIGTPDACASLIAMGAFCVWLLSKKIRAFQVVRG
jgi:ABC-2 type transport system permease protein